MVDEEMGMPAKRELSMRQLRHLLRLHHGEVSAREIGRRLGVARSTVQDNLKRAAAAGRAWAPGGRGGPRPPRWSGGCWGVRETEPGSGVGSSQIGRPWRAS